MRTCNPVRILLLIVRGSGSFVIGMEQDLVYLLPNLCIKSLSSATSEQSNHKILVDVGKIKITSIVWLDGGGRQKSRSIFLM